MKKSLVILALLSAFLFVPPALAQGPSQCNVSTSDPTYGDGQNRAMSCDTSGHLRTTAGGGTAPNPFAATTTEAKLTVAATNTFQAALASASGRKGCTLQYVAVAGSKGYVFFGSATPSDTTTSFQLTNGQSINCAIGGLGVATDQVLVTATQNDIFIVSNQ